MKGDVSNPAFMVDVDDLTDIHDQLPGYSMFSECIYCCINGHGLSDVNDHLYYNMTPSQMKMEFEKMQLLTRCEKEVGLDPYPVLDVTMSRDYITPIYLACSRGVAGFDDE